MAVPSNNVGLSDIQTEFGGSPPIGLSEYYSGGPLVPAGAPAPNGPIPSSGQISIGQFRGAENAVFIVANGGTITTSGDYKIHTFNGPGTFTVNQVGNPAGSSAVDYMVVAGGGGGGGTGPGGTGGGGGGGGWRASAGDGYPAGPSPLTAPVPQISVNAQGYPITVGGGGQGSRAPNQVNASKGGNSSGLGITSAGGGYGGSSNNINGNATSGGSGGGGGKPGGEPGPANPGGSGNSPPVSPPQGNSGGTPSNGGTSGGGGGGAVNAGGAPTAGSGATTSIRGSSQTFAAGGRGSTGQTAYPNGPANSGNGGGGAQDDHRQSGSGGSGIVVIRYKYQ